ncbi:unnamed protein product [Thlaspi arvense]|uniref:NmrA-like domain-containing protein n=1 Tax=Thlaspi arvense TaxID=13288 RepID=A0AAU9SYM7_THLAR|nr:unnamed protein product [Thlaspi arvense]
MTNSSSNVTDGLWNAAMSPFDHILLDVRVANSSSNVTLQILLLIADDVCTYRELSVYQLDPLGLTYGFGYLQVAGVLFGFLACNTQLLLALDASVDISTSVYISWCIRILAAVLIVQSSGDALLAGGALVFVIVMSPLLRKITALIFPPRVREIIIYLLLQIHKGLAYFAGPAISRVALGLITEIHLLFPLVFPWQKRNELTWPNLHQLSSLYLYLYLSPSPLPSLPLQPVMMASLRLPAQLVTRGTLNHHNSYSSASSSSGRLSWRRSLTPDNSIPSIPSSSSLNRKQSTVVPVTCSAAAVNLAPGTPVRPTSILVVGATGTLGRQIVRRALDEGYDVRCLVRPRPAPADFLRDWGATVVNADLSKPESIPATLVGIHTVIDCATGRPEEPIKTVDWEGKVALIQCAKAMGIQKYVFYSIHNCDKHPEVPLMEIKYCTEKFLKESGLNHITIRLCGFMQGLIGQYAVPILEEKSVWGTDAPTRVAYMDTQDIARLTLIALRNEKINGKLLTFAGPRAWTTQEVITLCERLAGQDANVTTVPVSVLRVTRQLTRFFQWTNDVADRLAFTEVLSSDTVFSVPMTETNSLLGVDQKDLVTLEKYLQDYFSNILKKLKDLKAQSKQSDIYF